MQHYNGNMHDEDGNIIDIRKIGLSYYKNNPHLKIWVNRDSELKEENTTKGGKIVTDI